MTRRSRALNFALQFTALLLAVCDVNTFAASAAEPASSAVSNAIPAHVLAEAKRRQLPLSSIKQQGEYWVSCVSNSTPSSVSTSKDIAGHDAVADGTLTDHANVSCAILGRAESVGLLASASTKLQNDRQQRTVQTQPRYRRESPSVVRTDDFKFVREYIDAHPNERFLVLVSVPSLCEPCRQMDELVKRTQLARSSGDTAIKTFILEFSSFGDAEREVLGHGALFPTTLAFAPATAAARQLPALTIGDMQGYSIDELSRSVRGKFQRGAPTSMSRGLISQESLLALSRATEPKP